MTTKLQIGDLAPDFTASSTLLPQLELSSFLGKYVILFFYPKDNTPGCTLEACAFSKNANKFKDMNCVPIGISRDSLASHTKFADKYNLEINLISDEDEKICNLYDVLGIKSFMGRKYIGISRTTFLIDPNGTIVNIWHKVNVIGHVNAILDLLSTIK